MHRPRTGPRPASRPQRTQSGGQDGGQVTGRDMVTGDTATRVGLTNREEGTEGTYWQLSRRVRSVTETPRQLSHWRVNYEEIVLSVCVCHRMTSRTDKNYTKNFSPLNFYLHINFVAFLSVISDLSSGDYRIQHMIRCCWTQKIAISSHKNLPMF